MLAESVRVTREELYEQVWSEPMQKLAKKYGISDVGLAKTCRRMRVPLPGRGYWAKKQFGKSVRRSPLPKLPPSTGSGIQDFIVRKPDVSADTDEAAIGPVAEQARFESDDANRIQVAEALADPHPLVARTVAALRRAKPNGQGYLVPTSTSLDVHVSLDGADRAMCIFDALLKGLDARGHATSLRLASQEDARAATIVRIGEADIAISLSERVDVVEHRDEPPAPPRENIARSRASWRPFTPPPVRAPRRELVSTGQFSLRIEHAYLGIRCTWSDGKKQRVDQCLNDFIVGLFVAAERLKALRIEREDREREWRAAEERRAQEARRREEEASRIRALDNVVSAWRDARDIRHYVADARTALSGMNEAPHDERVSTWLAWAEDYAARIDPLLPQPTVPKDPGPRHPTYGFR
jgi:hypothetical protein